MVLPLSSDSHAGPQGARRTSSEDTENIINLTTLSILETATENRECAAGSCWGKILEVSGHG